MSTCPINRTTVRNGIETAVSSQLDKSGKFTKEGDLYIPIQGTDFATLINDINNSYGENMVMPTTLDTDGFMIADPSDRLLDKYLDRVTPVVEEAPEEPPVSEVGEASETAEGVVETTVEPLQVPVQETIQEVTEETVLPGKPLTEKQEDDIEHLQRLGLLSKGYTVIDGKPYFVIPTLFNNPNVQAVRRLETAISNRSIDFLTIIDTGNEYLVRLEGIKPVVKGANEFETSQSSKAGEVTKAKVLKFLDNVGFRTVNSVSQLVYKGQKVHGSGYTDLANGIMQIVEGQEDYTLPEEAMHVLVALVKESRPELYKRMMKEIVNYKMYSTVLNDPAYANNKLYLLPDGTVNYDKIKEEAVAKLLAENLINNLEGTKESAHRMEETRNWWRTIKLWIQELFGKYKNPFEETLEEINKSDTTFGEFADVTSSDVFLSAKSVDQIDQETPDNKAIWESIKNRPAEYDITKIANDTENAYYKKGVKAPEGSRISDKVDKYYRQLFGNRGFDEAQKDFWENSRKDGDHIHTIMEEVINSFIDPTTGIMRKNPSKVDFSLSGNPIQGQMLTDLYNYLKTTMAAYPQGTRFITEQVIYDSVNDLYGTIDFAAIVPAIGGKPAYVDILDWKSMLMTDVEGAKDYKREGIFIQLGEYARILREEYGVENFGQIRAIPIKKTYSEALTPGDRKLVGIQIGNPNAAKIPSTQRDIRPIISPVESTGSEFKDEIIEKLSSLYQDYINKGYFKDERSILTHVQEAIYEIRVSNSVDNLANYFVDFKNEIKKLISSKDELLKSDNKEDTAEALALISFYENIFDHIVEPAALLNDDQSIDATSRGRLNREIYNITYQKRKLEDLRKELLNKRAEQKNIFGLLLPEKVVNLVGKLFRSMGSQNVATVRYMYELVKEAYNKIDIATDDGLKTLKELKFNFDAWQKSKGLNNKDALAMLVDYEQGKIHAKLDKSFLTARETAQLSRDKKSIKKFVEENYDLKEFDAWYLSQIEEIKKTNQTTTYDPDDKARDNKIKNNRIKTFETNYNIYKHPVTAFGYHNTRVWNKNIKEDLWLSPEYKALAQPGNEAVLAMYEHMIKKNKELAEINAIDDWQAYTFLPNVMKTFADIVDIDDNSSLQKVADLAIQQYRNFKSTISVDNYMLNYQGARDPYTGKKIEKRYIPYVSRIDSDFQIKVDAAVKFGIIKKGDPTDKLNEKIDAYKAASPANKQAFEREVVNSRQMSFDVFAMYGLMEKEINKEKYLLENDEIIRGLYHIEKNKKTFLQNKFGKLDLDANGKPKVSTEVGLNAGILEEHLKAVVNGESLQYDADHVIQFKLRDKWNKSPLAKLYKFDIDEETYKPTSISATKFLLWLNSANQKRILGVNLASALSNLFGGTYASNKLYQKYLSKDDLRNAWMKMTSGGFYDTEEMKKNAALVDYFLPLLQNRENFKASQLSVNEAAKVLSQEWLMMPMRKTSEIVQLNIFLALIENTGLVNGELVNIRDAVRAELKYDERYGLPEVERLQLEKDFEAKIKTMKEQFGLTKMAQFKTIKENGKDKVVIDIPGIDRNSESFYNLREISQTMSKDALGEADEFDLANYKYSIWWRLFMTFKNWIPRQADVRMGEFRYDQAHHSYEYGRFRMFARALSANFAQSAVKMIPLPYLTNKAANAMFSKTAIIERAKATYQEKLKNEKTLGKYNKDTFITEGEFVDKFIEGSDATFAEIRTLLFMMGLLFMGIAAPDDDDDAEDKAVKTLIRRQLNKLIDEVGFFYSPKSGIDIAGGGAPVFSIIRDGWYLGTNISEQFFGFGFDALGFDEKGMEWQESAKPIKRAFKMFPVLKEILTYLPAVDNETAKEWGVTVSDRRAQ